MHRFYLPAGQWSQPVLDRNESHHALDVLRLKEGDRITVFDGEGHEANARIASTSKGAAFLVLDTKSSAAILPCQLTLAQAVPKGKTMDLIIQKAVELGASHISPLISERTIVQVDTKDTEKKCRRWRETALEACKQCGQNRLPGIDVPLAPAQFFERLDKPELLLIASLQPDARPIKEVLAADLQERGRPPKSAVVLIGPEGDFTPAELAMAKSHGCLPITLGPIILRSETAAIYCLSVLAHELFSPPLSSR